MKTVSFSNYENASSAIEALKKSFQEEVPPIYVTFNTKSEVDNFANFLCPVKERKYATGYSFSCEHSKIGMGLIFKGYEIKSFPDSYYPITIRFKSYEEVLDFADDYAGVLVPKTAEDYKAIGKLFESEREALNAEKERYKSVENKHARFALITCLSMFVIAVCTVLLFVVPSNSSASDNTMTYENGSAYNQNVIGSWTRAEVYQSTSGPYNNAVLRETVTFRRNMTGSYRFSGVTSGDITNSSNNNEGFNFQWRMNGETIETLVEGSGWETSFYYKGGSYITDTAGNSFEKQ